MGRVELRGEPILITGASSGIGAATAVACARAGMPVALMARRKEKLDAVAATVGDLGVEAVVIEGDVTDAAACRRAVETCAGELGTPYAVFANAGFGFEKAFLETSDDELDGILRTNLWGTVNILRAALPPMIERGKGHALICSSSIGKFAVPYHSAYCLTKAAQWPIGHALAAELHHAGLHATTVHPIGTRTEFFDRSRERAGGSGQVSDNTPSFLMQDASTVAGSIVGALRRPKLEVWPGVGGRAARLAAGLLTAFPGMARPILNSVARKKLRDG